MSDRLINKVPVFAGQMGIAGSAGASRDRIGSVRLGHGLLKAHLPGLARIRQEAMAVPEREHRFRDALSPMGEAFGDGE
ncbi:hypothetical protein [Mesorhizobium huakuii]|uniref:hypothetical protein n=1 Tax=Mesorhizobium huakuii TaxID=28104 RepID=UPI001FD4DB6B|nr:hypothetical protein [Mesorhizobium huakuii]